MTTIFGLWKRCDWCGKISFLGLGWTKAVENSLIFGESKTEQKDYCSGICWKHERKGYDLDSGDTAKRGIL
jgi:hypothetical protein